MDWLSYATGFMTAFVLWFAGQVGRASARREFKRRLQSEEGSR